MATEAAMSFHCKARIVLQQCLSARIMVQPAADTQEAKYVEVFAYLTTFEGVVGVMTPPPHTHTHTQDCCGGHRHSVRPFLHTFILFFNNFEPLCGIISIMHKN